MRRLPILLTILLLTGCSAPTQQYPGSKKEGTFFAAPKSWHAIDMKSLQKYEKASTNSDVVDRASMVRFEVALSPNKNLSAADIFSLRVTDQPIAFLRVRDIYANEVNSVSYNSLRSVLVPVTRIITQPRNDDPELDLIDDYEVSDKGGRGVRTIYRVTVDGKSQVIDQQALISDDRRTLYVFVVRCSNECYNKNKEVMTKMADSFSVRGAR